MHDAHREIWEGNLQLALWQAEVDSGEAVRVTRRRRRSCSCRRPLTLLFLLQEIEVVHPGKVIPPLQDCLEHRVQPAFCRP